MNDDEARQMFETDPNFIPSRRYGYSLARFEQRYPDGSAPDHVIANALGMTEPEVEAWYARIVAEMQHKMGTQGVA